MSLNITLLYHKSLDSRCNLSKCLLFDVLWFLELTRVVAPLGQSRLKTKLIFTKGKFFF